jgi:hypothetical protein
MITSKVMDCVNVLHALTLLAVLKKTTVLPNTAGPANGKSDDSKAISPSALPSKSPS